MDVYVINVVTANGVANALVFDEPTEGHAFLRALLIDNDTGVTSWFANDEGALPHRESPDGDYTDLNTYGITWHHKK